MKLTITNSEQLNQWMQDRISLGHELVSIKGVAPIGATYSDGDLITQPVNVAWEDKATREVFEIEYLQREPTHDA